MIRSSRRLRRCLVVGVATLGFGVATPAARAESELGQLVVTEAPAGYALSTDPTAVSGDYTMQQFAEMAGSSLDGATPTELSGYSIFGRTWEAPSGALMVLLLRTPSDEEASDVVRGVLDGEDRAESFDTGIAGLTGRMVSKALPSRLIAWRQGPYAVLLVSLAFTVPAAEAAARELAAAQVERLRPEAGEPKAPMTDGLDLIAVLAPLGAVVLVLVVLALINARRSSKREKLKRLAPTPTWMLDQHRTTAPPSPHIPWQQDPPPTMPPSPSAGPTLPPRSARG